MTKPKLTLITSTAEFATYVRTARRNLKLTQAEVGERIGVRQSRVAEIERAPGPISCEQLLLVLKALGIQLYFCEPAMPGGSESPPPPPSTGGKTPERDW